jgi:hypothetical protein
MYLPKQVGKFDFHSDLSIRGNFPHTTNKVYAQKQFFFSYEYNPQPNPEVPNFSLAM